MDVELKDKCNENIENRHNEAVRASSSMLFLRPRRRFLQNTELQNVDTTQSQDCQSSSSSNRTVAKNTRISKKVSFRPPARVFRPIPCPFMSVVSEVLLEIPPGVTDIDEKIDDLEYDKHYAKHIMLYMKHLETRRKLPDSYLAGTMMPFNVNTRSILIDWLIQVQNYLKLHQETLYLTTNLFDHFCVKKEEIAAGKLQLLLLSCLLIACKLDERFSPELKVLMHLADDAYTSDNILKMEQIILSTLKFELVMPDPMVFLNRCLQTLDHKNIMLEHLSTFLIDVFLPDINVVRMLPSKLVAAAHCLARKILLQGEEACWSKTMEHYSGYNEESIRDVMFMLTNAVMEAPTSPNQGARKKYASKRRYQELSESPILKPEAIQFMLTTWQNPE